MPGMKQKVTEIVFGMKLSNGGKIDSRSEKHRIVMPFILLFSIDISFFNICFLDSFPTPSSVVFFCFSPARKHWSCFLICRNV